MTVPFSRALDPALGTCFTAWHATGHRHAEAAWPRAAAHIRDRFAAYEDSEFITS
ncbi:hypothetical protein [Amycolatopsis magusensis]|uniref:hypothetical protein n=1 Tax=Amycolatopsis magusensis TaxID=882444 RepID=UPI0037B98345